MGSVPFSGVSAPALAAAVGGKPFRGAESTDLDLSHFPALGAASGWQAWLGVCGTRTP